MQKNIYTYNTSWPVFSLNWSKNPNYFRLAFGSFVEEYQNYIRVIQKPTTTDPKAADFQKVADIQVNYPTTKLLWAPYSSKVSPDLLCTTGDYLRVWEFNEDQGKLVPKSTLANVNVRRNKDQKKDYCAPLTSFDWNITDPSLCVTSSVDTTCTIWDINTGQAKTQLIAHDKEVYDVAFGTGQNIFASCGADGSIRMFDTRQLEHSTIIYEVPDKLPLLRIGWNSQDPNYLATFGMERNSILILDVRVPAIPICQLTAHNGCVNSIAWAPHSSAHICSAGDDSQALVWDVSNMTKTKVIQDPLLAYNTESEINQIAWNSVHNDWIAVCTSNNVQALRV